MTKNVYVLFTTNKSCIVKPKMYKKMVIVFSFAIKK